MLATRVRATVLGGRGLGGELVAFTGLGPLGVRDPMRITRWNPPHVCTVVHLGRVVRGTGGFRVADLGDGRSAFHWWEDVELPFGVIGRLGWRVVRPLVEAFFRLSLTRFARRVEQLG